MTTIVAAIDLLLAWSWRPNLEVGLPVTAALAAIALIGYLFGRRTRQIDNTGRNARRRQEFERATGIARQLETIAGTLRQDLASHHGRLAEFRRRLDEAQSSNDDRAWSQLCSEAERILSPTMELAEQLSLAYDAIRQQSDALETFSRARVDPLTGVGNGRALDEKLEVLLGATRRGAADFSIALVSIDREAAPSAEPGRVDPKSQLAPLARLIQSCMRENDFVARYGDDEFVVVMPQTKLAGACVFADRLRAATAERLALTVSCGITQLQRKDTSKSLLGRADSACYSAKAVGGNRIFVHAGGQIRERRATDVPPAADAQLPATVLPPIPAPESVGLGLLATGELTGE
jgi:diguanylate cyclase